MRLLGGGMGVMKTVLACLYCMISVMSAKIIQVPGDFKTIQEGINASEPGDIVLVAPGTYSERIKLKVGIRVRSFGEKSKGGLDAKRAEKTIIDGSEVPEKDPGVMMAAGATLDGFSVTGVGKYDEEKWQKSWVNQGADQAHEHIGGFGVPGIAIEGVDCSVVNNIVHHIGDTGIAIRGIEGANCAPLVRGNVCYRNMGGGIGSMEGSAAIIDSNTCYENFYSGIGHNNASPIVTRNTCYRNIRAGIGVSEGACPIVRGNSCYENRKAGIGIRTGSETSPIVENNDCYKNEMAGIGVEEKATPIILGNRCKKNGLAGIGCRDGASAMIRGNRCESNKAAGIGLESASAEILRNQINLNEKAGIGISGRSFATLVNNICLGNKLVGLGIPGEAKVVVASNSFSRQGGMPPMVMVGEKAEVTMTGNTIQGGGIAGVLLMGKLTAIDNLIEGANGGSGIWVREGAELTRKGNKIKGYKAPVRGEKP